MIVQCDQCSAKFRLDDAKIKEGGAKVRCSKCKHIFVVQREAPAEEADFDSFLNGLVPQPSESTGEPGGAVAAGAGEPAAEAGESSPAVASVATEAAGGAFPEKAEFDFGEFDFTAGPAVTPPAAPLAAEEKGDFDFGEVDLGSGDAVGKESEAPAGGAPSFDDDAFFFSEEPPPPLPEVDIKIEGLEEPGAAGEPFGTDTPSSPAPAEDFSAAPPLEFSFEPEAEEPQEAPAAPAPEQGSGQPTAFDFGEFEFDEAATSEQPAKVTVPPGEPEEWGWEQPEPPPQEQPATPPPFAQISAPDFPEMPIAEEELPPLSIASRRKGSSVLPVAVTAVCVLLVLALAGGGFYFVKEGPAAFDKFGLGFMAKWFGLEAKEEGGISVRNTAAAFLHNKEAGELFVINGEAVNNFAKPRASIQVKVTLFGPKGEVLSHKTAYCGNAVSREQLATLPMAKLEAAMANQFGDSLSNLAVQPGKGIPFVVVFTNIPKEAADFGVEVVGSTVASQ